jgi:transcriptional regulator with GAF, ATPase, and Fis domain
MGKTHRLEPETHPTVPNAALKLHCPQNHVTHELKSSQYIGSDLDNDIAIPKNPYVSKTHAKIYIDKSGVPIVEDLGSTNGTFINHRSVLKSYLVAGDTLTFGNTHFFCISAKAESSKDKISQLTSQLGILIDHPKLIHIYEQAFIFAQTKETICISGDTGTGKDLLAQFIHHCRTENKKPFQSINMSTLPENLIEFELFGAKKGSFTGAIQDTPGLMEQGKDGTLFMDEIAELPLHLQPKLLRALENREVRRIGETKVRTLRCAFIFATHQNLKEKVKNKSFREDLFHRIHVLPLSVPALDDLGDMKIKIARKLLSEPFSLSEDATHKLNILKFSGNIRELKNTLIRAQVLAKAEGRYTLSDSDLFPN